MLSKRLKFFLGHFAISVIICFIVAYIVFFVWYPMPLHKALGVGHLIAMLLVIDVIVGPLLGWFVYKEGKKTLKFDLAVVILLQISAFAYGFYSIAKGRPAWIVYESYAFHVVKASDVSESRIDKALPEYRQTSWLKPQFVALQTPPKQVLLKNMQKNTIAMDHPMYYRPLTSAKDHLIQNAAPLAQLLQYNNQQVVQNTLKQNPKADGWLPLSGMVQDMVVLIDKEQGEVIKIVDLRPWN